MTLAEKRKIYDRACRAISNFEHADSRDDKIVSEEYEDASVSMYVSLYEIVQRFEDIALKK